MQVGVFELVGRRFPRRNAQVVFYCVLNGLRAGKRRGTRDSQRDELCLQEAWESSRGVVLGALPAVTWWWGVGGASAEGVRAGECGRVRGLTSSR